MEYIIIPIIIAVLLILLGVKIFTLASLLYSLLALILILMLIFFAVFSILALMCKRQNATFLRFEKNRRFDSAIYVSSGEEFKNIFPAENILRDKIYPKNERRILIRRGKKRSYAIDRHSLLIIIAGLILSSLSLAVLAANAAVIFA